MTKKQTAIITALSVIAIILAMLVTGRYWLRFDLTKNKAYTISKVSRNIHRDLPEPVNITYYLSNKLKTVIPSPGEIEDMLREYAAYSRGKIHLTVRDPIKAGMAAIDELGLQARQVPIVEQDQTSLITVYSGIIIEYLDKTEVLPWVISTETLEYDLTSRIRAMVRESERWVGVIVGDNFRSFTDDFSFMSQTFQQAGYNVRQILPGEEIPENTPALFVMGGVEELDHWALYRIDRYIQTGGKVLFAVRGVFIDTAYSTIEARALNDLGLLEMIASYGVTIRPELTLDRNALTLQYQTRTPSGGVQYRITRYPHWIGIAGENGNESHPVSAGFNGIDLYWASPLEINIIQDIEPNVLFTSSSAAWTMSKEFHTNPDIPYLFEIEANGTTGYKIMGAALSGVFPSFFRGAEKPVREGSNEELPDIPETGRPSRIIVVGETNFASNFINVSQARKNLDFLLRAADWLASDDDIIGIRNRQQHTGRFDKIAEPSKRAFAMKFAEILNVGIVPLLVIAFGIFRATRRSKAIKNAQIAAASGSDNNEQSAKINEHITDTENNREKNNDI
ncbi:MAG: GldG family protein [Treponema sp.]|nr:GldG family protein [Treponema sp.]